MASTPLLPLVNAFDLTTAFQTLFIVGSGVNFTGIDAVVFNNYSAANVEISVRIVQSGTSTVLNEVITGRVIRSKESFLAPSLIGQSIQTGGKIEAKASVNSSINVNITGTNTVG